MSTKPEEKRFRKYAIQRNYQFETHDENGNLVSDETESEWKSRVIREWTDLETLKALDIAYIFHDKDINDDGTSKGLHVHAVVTFKDSIPQSNAMKLSGCSSKQNCQGVKNKVGAYRYLIHITEKAINEGKHIYPVEEVVTLSARDKALIYRDAIKHKKTDEDEKDAESAMIRCLSDVVQGNESVASIRRMYVEDSFNVAWNLKLWYKQKSTYEQAEREWLQSMQEWYQLHNRCLTNIYISGIGGVGKSTLGERLAASFADFRGVHKPASPGEKTTFDFAGDYHGELVTLFNEFTAAFPVEQFLDIFDPIRATFVNSRNSDKIWFASYGIFTTSRSLEQFLWDIWTPYSKSKVKLTEAVRKKCKKDVDFHLAYERANTEVADKIRQIRRRFAILVKLENGFAHVYFRDDSWNVPHIYFYDSPEVGQEPFKLFKSLPFDVNDIGSIDCTIAAIKETIAEYYRYNKLSITPDNVQKPLIELNG